MGDDDIHNNVGNKPFLLPKYSLSRHGYANEHDINLLNNSVDLWCKRQINQLYDWK